MNACSKCKKLGKVIEEQPKNYSHTFGKRKKREDVKLEVVSNYASIINKEMAKRSMNIKQLAMALNIKDTTLNKYLSNKVKMEIDTARKFENYFEIKLVEEVENVNPDEFITKEEVKEEGMSLGDLLMKKLKEGK